MIADLLINIVLYSGMSLFAMYYLYNIINDKLSA